MHRKIKSKMEKKIDRLAKEVKYLKQLYIESILNIDTEGEYRPEFVKEVKRIMKMQPTLKFEGRGSLIRQIRNS